MERAFLHPCFLTKFQFSGNITSYHINSTPELRIKGFLAKALNVKELETKIFHLIMKVRRVFLCFKNCSITKKVS